MRQRISQPFRITRSRQAATDFFPNPGRKIQNFERGRESVALDMTGMMTRPFYRHQPGFAEYKGTGCGEDELDEGWSTYYDYLH